MSYTRLPFKIPEYTPRVSWASALARQTWEPRINAVSQAWIVSERDSVSAGIRPSALQPCTPEELPNLMRVEAGRRCMVLPLTQIPKVNGYQAASTPLQPGAAFDYKVVVTKADNAGLWVKAWADGDNDLMGNLLGTPKCCIIAFERFWVRDKWMDLTVPTCLPTSSGYNGLLRWLGVRGVSYMPCSPNCQETQALAKKLNELLPEPVRTWHRELLSFPTLYTSLHGVAEITTPLFRVSVPSDALAEKVEVKHLGKGYPAEGAQGLGFPYRSDAIVKKLSLKPIQPASQNPADNGFKTLEAQDTAHNKLLDTLLKGISGPYSVVLDLGCGDGSLLAKIPATTRVGVESDPDRARKAKTRLNDVILGDCTDTDTLNGLLETYSPDLVIAQRHRNPPETLKGYQVLSYSYDTTEPPRLIGAA